MRIVVVETDGLGGLAHWAYQLCNALADEGAEVTLLTSRHYELREFEHRFRLDASLPMWANVNREANSMETWPRALAWVVHRLRRIVRGVILVRVWARLTRVLLAERPDVVQFSLIRFPFLAVFLRRLRRAGLRLTLVCHEPLPRDATALARRVNRAFGNPVYQSFRHIFFLGNAVRAQFLCEFAIPHSLTSVIPMGDASLFRKVERGEGDLRHRYALGVDTPVALFFGGLRRSKGIADLIRAFREVSESLPDARLLVAGVPQAGIFSADIAELAKTCGVETSVIVDARYVPLDEVAALVRTADVVVLPYASATTSAVLQVAYACERPVVATRVGALPEAIVEGATGWTVEPGDPHALAVAMLDALGHRTRARAMGIAGARLAAEQHAWTLVARRIAQTSRQLLAREAIP